MSRATWIAAVLAAVGWLPFVRLPASPDEGGFLLIASQWHSGHGLYGDYWVDRPPLLLGIHEVAAALGGTVALRVIGVVGVVVAVFLASRLVRDATAGARQRPGTIAMVAPVVIAATFLTTPLFGTTQVDGELLAVPFVLAGIVAYVRASVADTRTAAIRWSLTAGAAAAGAVMVKQNAVDVFVFAAAVVAVRVLAGDRRRAVRIAAVFATGAVAAATVILGAAALRGTSISGLWDSVVTFRFQAASIIQNSATGANTDRLHGLLQAVAASLAPLVVAVLGCQSRRRPAAVRGGRRTAPDLRWPAVALIGWELVAIAGGGSFWLHYLLGLVPGLVVLAVAAAQRAPSLRRTLAGVLAGAVLSGGIATVAAAYVGPDYSSDDRTITYLREHARPGDTATVAFGHPNILWDARLDSPYQHLWSLPVRVRDPQLADLRRVLTSDQAPTWVVVAGSSLDSWGINATRADQVLLADYHRVAIEGHYYIWHINEGTR